VYDIGAFSWRVAFLVVGFPGVLVALLALRINDPVRGINDIELNETESSADDLPGSPLRGDAALSPQPDGPFLHAPKDGEKSVSLDDKVSGNNSDVRDQEKICRGACSDMWSALRSQVADAIEICSNPYYFFSVMGFCASNFALGTEWPSYN
jgi:hypothetical protein